MNKLSKNDIDFMLETIKDMPKDIANKLHKLRAGQIDPEDISIDEYDSLRDLCGDLLQICGFDEHYNPTEKGKILEDLIDKLYTG